jgi:acetate kinase
MAMDPMILISNPGSASRKYALYEAEKCRVKIHFEYIGGKIVYSLAQDGKISEPMATDLSHLTFAASKVFAILQEKQLLQSKEQIKTIVIRVVAPSSYFQADRLLSKRSVDKLTELEPRASLHINASLQESHMLEQAFPRATLISISDSAFHGTMPDHARNYALPLDDADNLDIKRFGYHGLSVESVVHSLKAADKLPLRLIVCHLGSGASITAVKSGKSVDTTMGYSPLEGLMMASRSGNLDIMAAMVLQQELKLSDQALEDYLNHRSGLLGVSGTSSDIRELLKMETEGDIRAKLALGMYIYRIQQAIGQMAAVLGGVDALVFTGTVGERSVEIRKRTVAKLLFLGLGLDPHANHAALSGQEMALISPPHHPAKIYIVPADEDSMMARHAKALS